MPYKNPEDERAHRAKPEQREKQRARSLKWRAANPERAKEQQLSRTEKKRQILSEAIGDCCAFCGSTDRLEMDHINPGLKHLSTPPGTRRDQKCSRSIAHIKEQLALDNLRWLCYTCHRDHSTAQHKAAIELFNSLPLTQQEELIMRHL